MTDDTTPGPPDAAPSPPESEAEETSTDTPPGPPDGPQADEDDPAARKARREAQGLRQRLHDTEAVSESLRAEITALRAAQHAHAIDQARADAAARYRIPAALAGRITGTTPEEIQADAAQLGNQLRMILELPLLGLDPGPIRTRTLDVQHAINRAGADAYDRNHGTTATDRMTDQVRGLP